MNLAVVEAVTMLVIDSLLEAKLWHIVGENGDLQFRIWKRVRFWALLCFGFGKKSWNKVSLNFFQFLLFEI